MPQDFPFPTRIAFEEALAIVERVADARRMPVERVALHRAHGAILARDRVAGVAQPPFDNSAMDGFALRHADLHGEGTTLRLVGEHFAGRALDLAVRAGECVRITTGAPLPEGADTVVMKENTRFEPAGLEQARVDAATLGPEAVDHAAGVVTILVPPSPGQHVRRAGEDTRVGDRVLAAGMPLSPSRLALAASQGLAELEVARRPTVAVFTTGDELVEPGMPLAPGQLYNSNREQLMGLLRADGLDPVAWPTLPDDPARIESALVHAGHAFDLVLTCGAVSAGEKDHLPALLQAQGEVHFWKVRMRPGMPVLFAGGGTLGDALFLCLPGNPVSVLATYLALARPLLDRLQGRAMPRPRWRARLAAPWRKAHDRLEFLRGRLHQGDDGRLEVEPNPADGSHRMRAAADSDALVMLAEGARDYPAGATVDVLPYAERG
jgi:molybdopterin molybdotransferase